MRKLKKGRVLQAAWAQLREDTDQFMQYAKHELDAYIETWYPPAPPIVPSKDDDGDEELGSSTGQANAENPSAVAAAMNAVDGNDDNVEVNDGDDREMMPSVEQQQQQQPPQEQQDTDSCDDNGVPDSSTAYRANLEVEVGEPNGTNDIDNKTTAMS